MICQGFLTRETRKRLSGLVIYADAIALIPSLPYAAAVDASLIYALLFPEKMSGAVALSLAGQMEMKYAENGYLFDLAASTLSLFATLALDVDAGRTTISEDLYSVTIGQDSHVSFVTYAYGLVPEANVGAGSSLAQLGYDLGRASGGIPEYGVWVLDRRTGISFRRLP